MRIAIICAAEDEGAEQEGEEEQAYTGEELMRLTAASCEERR